MKIQNTGLDNAYAIVRGWVSSAAAAATGLISVSDETTGVSVGPVSSMTFVGQLLKDGGAGSLFIDVQAVLTEYTNNSGVDLIAGDVVVIDTSADEAVTTTTTAQDTRPVGVVLGSIGAGGTGPVQTGGIVQSINVTASVTRGNYAETSTVAKQATQNATRRTGSFGIYLKAGTTPAVLLFGITDPNVIGTNAELNIQGGQSVIKAHGNLGATATFAPVDGNVHTGTLNANCTFTLSAPTGSGASLLEFRITQDGTGGRTISWPGSVTWADGTPAPSTTLNTTWIYLVESVDGGTTWIGRWGGLASTAFATPAIVLGTAASAGTAATTIRSDGTIKAFNNVTPTAIAYGTTVGTSPYAAEADHGHNTPLSTKGDLLVTDGAVLNRLGVGTGGQLLTADSTATNGVAWADAPASGGVGPDHAHVADERHLSDGSTTTYTLDEFFLAGSVEAMNITTLAWLGVTEAAPDQATVSAAGTTGDTIQFTYAALAV